MRIPCAKCGHLHDSTVTPFPHDIIDGVSREIHPVFGVYTKDKTSSFICVKCGGANSVTLSWTVVDETLNMSEINTSDSLDSTGS